MSTIRVYEEVGEVVVVAAVEQGPPGGGMRWRGEWDIETQYSLGDGVFYGTMAWVAQAPNVARVPGVDPEWSPFFEGVVDIPEGGESYQILAVNPEGVHGWFEREVIGLLHSEDGERIWEEITDLYELYELVADLPGRVGALEMQAPQEITANHMLQSTDVGTYLRCSHATGIVLTLPTPESLDVPTGAIAVQGIQAGAGKVGFAAGTGATIFPTSIETSGSGAAFSVRAVSATAWDITGNLSIPL